MIGKSLIHYEVLSKLGEGGMGEVYVAHDTKLDRKIALKVLPVDVASDPERRMRFEREAKAIAALSHPNIVTIHSVEESDGVHFITMELVEGKTLTEILPRDGLGLAKLLEYATSIADAVSSAHRKGITHRDLKPDNIMLGEDGRIKVLDFGLAKLQASTPAATEGTSLPTESMTEAGKVLGTVAYMSPEQAEGKSVDERSDIFSLGVVLYQMATGKRPFVGDTPMSTLSSILRDTPESVTDLNHNLPRHLGRIIKHCLEKDPERRYQSAQDLRNELEGLKEEWDSGVLQSSSGISIRSTLARKTTLNKWVIGAIALVVVAVLAVLLSGVLSRPDTAARAPAVQNMEIVRLTSNGRSKEATISGDGRYVVHQVEDGGQLSLRVVQVNTRSSVEIVAPSEATVYDPAFSLDGDFVYYVRQEKGADLAHLYRVPSLGGDSRRVIEQVDGRVSFDPDGQRMVFLRRDRQTFDSELVSAGLDGSGEKVLSTLKAPDTYDDPVWSPDGKTIAVAVFSFSEGIKAQVMAIPVEGGEAKPISDQTWGGMDEISWLPDGSGLVLTAADDPISRSQLWEVSYPQGVARRITNDLNGYHGTGVTADGKTLVTQVMETSSNLWVTEPGADAKPKKITSGTRAVDSGMDWAEDGTIFHGSNRSGTYKIWSMQPEGTGAKQITTGEAIDVNPQATPDGLGLTFISLRAGTVNVWRSNRDGTNVKQVTSGKLEFNQQISADGQWIYYATAGPNIYKAPIDGGEPQVVIPGRVAGYDLSPDGEQIMARVWNTESQVWQVGIYPIEGGAATQTIDIGQGSQTTWSPDGEAITYVLAEEGILNLWNRPLDGGEPIQLTFFDDEELNQLNTYAWSPDGSQLVISRGSQVADIVLLKNFR
ncbi:MAG: protein kinase [Thermoanaerobaculia bacterium]